MKISKILAGMSAAAIVAAMAVPASAESTVIWSGTQELATWNDYLSLTTSEIASVNSGDTITLKFTQTASGAQLQVQDGSWSNIPGFGNTDWGGVDLEADDTSYSFTLSAEDAAQINDNINQYDQILNVKGQNIELTEVTVEEAAVTQTYPMVKITVDESGKPVNGSELIYPIELNGFSDEQLKSVDKVVVNFNAQEFFNGTLGADTVAKNGWDSAGQLDGNAADNTFTWSDIGGLLVNEDGSTNLELQIWWMNAIGSAEEGFAPATLEIMSFEIYDADGEMMAYLYNDDPDATVVYPEDDSSSESESEASSQEESSSSSESLVDSSSNSSVDSASSTNNPTSSTTPTAPTSSKSANENSNSNPTTGASTALAATGVILAGAAVVAAKKKK